MQKSVNRASPELPTLRSPGILCQPDYPTVYYESALNQREPADFSEERIVCPGEDVRACSMASTLCCDSSAGCCLNDA